jgi:hypothetical protein
MALTTHDVLLDPDLFRRAQPSWPHPEPVPEPDTEHGHCRSCGHIEGCDCSCCTEGES